MKYIGIGLGILLLSFFGCAAGNDNIPQISSNSAESRNFLQGALCYVCGWADTTDKEIRGKVEHEDNCKNNIDYVTQVSRSGLHGTDYICVEVAGKYNGVAFIIRRNIKDVWDHTKDDTCDSGQDVPDLPFKGSRTHMKACYCFSNQCNKNPITPSEKADSSDIAKPAGSSAASLFPPVVVVAAAALQYLFLHRLPVSIN